MISKVYKLDKLEEGLYWFPKEKIRELWGAEEDFPVDEIILLPFYITELFNPQICIQSLVLGTIYASDLTEEDVKKVKAEKGVDVSKQQKHYKQLLSYLFHEIALESNILNLLVGLKEEKGLDFAIKFYRKAVHLLPSSKVLSDYINAEVDYLYNNPQYRSPSVYEDIVSAFSNIKKEEVFSDAWENLVIINYCATGLLGKDTTKCPYIKEISNDTYKSIVKNQYFEAIFE